MKKLISFILIISFIMTSFTVYASKYLETYKYMDEVFEFDVGEFVENNSDEVIDNEDTRRIKLLYSFGIWDDIGKSPEEFITMTEFSIIMAKLKVGSENAFEGVYKLDSNADTTNVTYFDAYGYLIDALGYTNSLKMYSDPQKATLIVATQIGLISGNTENAEAYITRAALAGLIEKALEIDMCIMEFAESGGYSYTVVEGKTLLNTVHGIHEINGFVNAVPGLAVFGGTSLRDGFIQINRSNVSTAGLDLTEYFGSYVKAYAKYDEKMGIYNIITMDYAEEHKSIEIDFRDIVEIKNSKVYYMDSQGFEQEVDVSSFDYITENGDGLTSISQMSSYAENEGKIVITSTEKNGAFNAAIIYRYSYFVSSYNDVRMHRIGIEKGKKYKGNGYVQLTPNKPSKVIINGEVSDIESLSGNMAIRFFECESTGYTEFIANSSRVFGNVTGLYEDTVAIGDKNLRMSVDVVKYLEDTSVSATEKPSQLKVGLDGIFYEVNGIIAGYTTSQTMMWGYLKDMKKERTAIDPSFTLRILDEGGTWRDIRVEKNIELDGKNGVTKEMFLATIEANAGTSNDILGELVRFSATSDNVLTAIDTAIVTEYEKDSMEDVECVDPDFNEWFNWTYEYNHYSPYWMSSETVVFVIPDDCNGDEKQMRIIKNTGLPTGYREHERVPCRFYTPDEYKRLAAIICKINPDDLLGGVSAGDNYYVESVRRTIIDADNQIYGYRIYGKQFSPVLTFGASSLVQKAFYVTDDIIDKNKVAEGDSAYDDNLKIEAGDLITVSGAGGNLESWTMLLNRGVIPEVTPDDDEVNELIEEGDINSTTRGTGILVKVNTAEDMVIVNVDGEEKVLRIMCKAIIDTENNKITNVTSNDFHPGEKVYYRGYVGRAFFILKNE